MDSGIVGDEGDYSFDGVKTEGEVSMIPVFSRNSTILLQVMLEIF